MHSLNQELHRTLEQKFKGRVPPLRTHTTNLPDTSQFLGHRCHCGCCNCRVHKGQAEGGVLGSCLVGASPCGNRVHSPECRQRKSTNRIKTMDRGLVMKLTPIPLLITIYDQYILGPVLLCGFFSPHTNQCLDTGCVSHNLILTLLA